MNPQDGYASRAVALHHDIAAHAGVYGELQSVAPGESWRESFRVESQLSDGPSRSTTT